MESVIRLPLSTQSQTDLFFAFGASHTKGGSGNHTALIEINGVIGEKEEVNAKDFFESVQRAYESRGTKGIILKIK